MVTQAQNRYQSILLQSAKLFRQRGYPTTTIRDIGDALGITSAALYYHFKNKEELLLEMMLIALRELTAAVQAALQDVDDPIERVRIAMRQHLAISTAYQDFAIVLLQEIRHLGPEARTRVIAERDAYEKLWGQLFYDARSAGLYKPEVDVRLLRLLTFGALNLVVTWYRPSGAYGPEEIADALFAYVTAGVVDAEKLEMLTG